MALVGLVAIGSGVAGLVAWAGIGPAWSRDGTGPSRYEVEVIVHLAGPPERLAHALAVSARSPSARVMSTRVDPACGRPGGRVEPCPSGVRNTVDEALLVRRVVGREGIGAVLVVTSPWHLPRTRLIFRTVFAGAGVALGFDAPAATGTAGEGRLRWQELLKTPGSVAAAVLGRCCPGAYETALAWLRPSVRPRRQGPQPYSPGGQVSDSTGALASISPR